jgi:molecular chaperone GrpE (heat shock protein)
VSKPDNKTKKELEQEIARLKRELKELRERVEKVNEDRERYRNWFTGKLKWFLQLLGENKTPEMKFLIEDMSKLLSKCDRFYW